MKNTMLLIAIAAALTIGAPSIASSACSGGGTTWTCEAGSTVANVTSALSAASDGATITFASGSYTFGSRMDFSNSKGVTLVCETVGACTINFTTNTVFATYSGFSGTNTKLYRISGFVFDGGGSGTNSGGTIWFSSASSSPTTISSVRIDHNTFQNYAAGRSPIYFGDSASQVNVYGVIDHNTFTGASAMVSIQYIGKLNSNPPVSQIGTANNLFVEDNTMTFTTMNPSASGCTDGYGGAAYVARFNTSTNCLWTAHGITHFGGPANYEFYGNTVILNSGINGTGFEDCYRCVHHQGSGTFLAFNNAFTAYSGKSAQTISMLHYRSSPRTFLGYSSTYEQCDGTNVTLPDGNRDPVATYRGYPCWHQPGRDTAGNLFPMYAWNNYWSDTSAKVDLDVRDLGGSPTYFTAHLQANRDWYNAPSKDAQTSSSAPFDGTVGVGFGTLANRPATCTANAEAADAGKGGVGYWATNEGEWDSTNGATADGRLYLCTATNTWTLAYTPYTYPHPLTAGDNPPAAPPQPPPAGTGYYQAHERPAAGSRPTAGTRRELEISGGPYVLDENHSPAEAIVNENDTLLMEE